MLAANKLENQTRRADRARYNGKYIVTCPASRHLHLMAAALAKGQTYHMLSEDPKQCAGTMLSVLESLWKARAEIKRLKGAQTDF